MYFLQALTAGYCGLCRLNTFISKLIVLLIKIIPDTHSSHMTHIGLTSVYCVVDSTTSHYIGIDSTN